MALTRQNFGDLLTPGQSKIFFDSYNEFDPQYTKIFKLEKSYKQSETIPHVGSFGLWSANTEGSAIPMEDIEAGTSATFVHKRFDKGYEITWEMLQDDQYGIFKGTAGNGGNARLLGRSLRATVETEAAKVLSDGFTVNGYDGTPLFSAGHKFKSTSTATHTNLVTGVLNDANLKAACKALRTQKDASGVALIAAVPEKLIVPPDLEFTARALVNSIQVAGSSLNDANTLPALEVVVLDYLTSPTAWFVQGKGCDNLMFFWREEPYFGSQPVAKKMDWFYYGFARFSCGYADWRGIVGSKGV